jgi:hypothetical protein
VPDTQLVHPVHPIPPHCPQCADTQPVEVELALVVVKVVALLVLVLDVLVLLLPVLTLPLNTNVTILYAGTVPLTTPPLKLRAQEITPRFAWFVTHALTPVAAHPVVLKVTA